MKFKKLGGCTCASAFLQSLLKAVLFIFWKESIKFRLFVHYTMSKIHTHGDKFEFFINVFQFI